MDLKDYFALAGTLLIGTGMYLIGPQYAFLSVGVILFALGVWPKR